MPKIYQYLGLSFYFWANEHLPIHVHIRKGERLAIAEFIMENGKLVDIKISKKRNTEMLSPTEINDAKTLLFAKKDIILKRWMDFFVTKAPFRTITITKRIK